MAFILFFLAISCLHLFYLEDSMLFPIFLDMWQGSWMVGFGLFLGISLVIALFASQATHRQYWLPKGLALLVAYIIAGLAVTIFSQHSATQTHLLHMAFISIGLLGFFLAGYFKQASPMLRMSGMMILVIASFTGFGHWLPQVEGGFPPKEHRDKNVFEMTTQQRADLGETIIFGGIGQSKVHGAIGRGQCPLCHSFFPEYLSERAPNLWGITARKRLHATSIESMNSLNLKIPR